MLEVTAIMPMGDWWWRRCYPHTNSVLEQEKKKEAEDKKALLDKTKADHEQWASNQVYLRNSLHSTLYAEKEIRLSQIAEKEVSKPINHYAVPLHVASCMRVVHSCFIIII